MRCPHCKNQLLQKSGSQVRARIEGPMVWDAESLEANARCYWCKGTVTLPIHLSASADMPSETFVVPVRKRGT